MHQDRTGAAVFIAAASLFALILAFNLGRLDVATKPRHCQTAELSYHVPFKGTLP